MIIFTILIAVVFLLGALVLYLYASYIEHKGYMRGLDCDGCREHWLKRDAVDFGGLLYWKKSTTYGEEGAEE